MRRVRPPAASLLTGARLMLALVAAVPATLRAAAVDDDSLPRWSVAGYGTLARSWDDVDHLAPIRDLSQRPADGQETGPTSRMDSRLAVHASYRHSPEWLAVAQVVARDQLDKKASGALERAYAEWAPGQWRWRAGRVGYDVFLMSDHRNLGFASLPVRPPTEFYGWVPNYSVDGVDLTHDVDDIDGRWRVRFQTGHSQTRLPIGGTAQFVFDSQNLWSMTVGRTTGDWRLKGGVSEFRIEHDPAFLTPLHGGLAAVAAAGVPGISAEAATLRAESAFAGARVSYATMGAAFDDGVWTAQGEIGLTRTTAGIVTHGRSGYLTLGRRFGDLQPYLGYAISRPQGERLQALTDWSVIGQRGLQDAALFAINGTRIDQATSTVGARWDLGQRIALKGQWDHIRIKAQGYALWFREFKLNARDTSVNLVTLALDFVF